jgi:hypothetical protein
VERKKEARCEVPPPGAALGLNAGLDRGRKPGWYFNLLERRESRDGPPKKLELVPATDTFRQMFLYRPTLSWLDFIFKIGREMALNLFTPHHVSK